MRNKFLLALFSGLMLSLGWLSVSGLPMLIAVAPLLYISGMGDGSRCSFWRTFAYVALALGLWSGATVWWVWYASPLGAILAVLFTVILMGGVFMLFHYVSKRSSKVLSYVVLVCGWVAVEYIYTVGEISFPWLTLGNGFANDVIAVQWYEFTGVFGGSLWVLLCNVLIYEAFLAKNRTRWIVAAAMVVLPLCYSVARYFTFDQGDDKVKVAVVQPNIDPYADKFTMGQDEQVSRLAELVMQADGNVDYVVMPETAIDDGLTEGEFEHSTTVAKFRMLLRERFPSSQFIMGATTYRFYNARQRSETARATENPDSWYDVFNTAFSIDSSTRIDLHHKSKLVLGVEKIPYYKLFKNIEFLVVDLGGITGQLGMDTTPHLMTSPKGTVTNVAICYESIYGGYLSEFVRRGSKLMIVITNDGWWRDTPGYRQHFSFSRLRAIEFRRGVARSANTGISGLIDSRGVVVDRLGWDRRGIIMGYLPLNSKITFYARYGDYIGRLCGYVFCLSMLYFLAYRVRRKDKLVK